MKTISHVAIDNNWVKPNQIINPKTLILGSFNPNNSDVKLNTDYYYGRSTNYFWKIIAELINENENYFCGNLERKLEIMNKYSFCFLDLINSIEVSSDNDTVLDKFIQKKIFLEFSDQILFRTTTNFENYSINIKRNYNFEILDYLNEIKFTKIIHTLGNNTINQEFKTNPKENSLGEFGFERFVNQIKRNGVKFESKSLSPSGRAVKVGKQEYYLQLKEWIQTNLKINE